MNVYFRNIKWADSKKLPGSILVQKVPPQQTMLATQDYVWRSLEQTLEGRIERCDVEVNPKALPFVEETLSF